MVCFTSFKKFEHHRCYVVYGYNNNYYYVVVHVCWFFHLGVFKEVKIFFFLIYNNESYLSVIISNRAPYMLVCLSLRATLPSNSSRCTLVMYSAIASHGLVFI